MTSVALLYVVTPRPCRQEGMPHALVHTSQLGRHPCLPCNSTITTPMLQRAHLRCLQADEAEEEACQGGRGGWGDASGHQTTAW